ncbi:MAG: hypothetical protein J7545_00285 [Roseofilum sp. SBFL]|uniref:hypothetical protein n=1 Tax=unclassified Roseofilum TaxID=2620099 RepID=UPI001B1F08F2|nr:MULTISPECIES: hypothetical protein [unclassified Roseofilum]MBP0014424.1 hypothetical protein [Roseofilum sp. SID3]MBP0026535.1 hypothetical protein [Roseofilum sp. SID2]MBP0036237.1 hypothetical protein [Roseofilum sp. SID1]MBP0040404.1 hypothetical protein [Roseofilum sp. SBFL]
MSTQITITLPDDVYLQAKRFAQLANRDLASVLADTIISLIPPVRSNGLDLKSISSQKKVELYNPREQQWSSHFTGLEDGTRIQGITACGRATAIALKLNNPYAVAVRQAWVSAGWHPPEER